MKEAFIVYEITNERKTGKGKSFNTLREAKEFIRENKGNRSNFEFYIEKELENNKELITTYKLKPAKKPELTAEEIKEIEALIKTCNAIAEKIGAEKKINTSKLEEKLEEIKKYLSWKACK